VANKQPEATARTRQALMDAFWELYERTPLDRVTVLAVTRLAGYNRSTFYQYFGSVEDVQTAWEDWLIGVIGEVAEARLAQGLASDVPAEIAALFEARSERLVTLVRRDPGFAQRLRDTVLPFHQAALGLPAGDPRSAYVAEFALAGQIAVLTRWHDRHDLPQAGLLAMTRDIVTKGFLGLA
jgi:AcrR family transcriptional regulator